MLMRVYECGHTNAVAYMWWAEGKPGHWGPVLSLRFALRQRSFCCLCCSVQARESGHELPGDSLTSPFYHTVECGKYGAQNPIQLLCRFWGAKFRSWDLYTKSPPTPSEQFPWTSFFFYFFTHLNKQKPSRSSSASFIDFVPNMNQADVCEYKFVHKIITKLLLEKAVAYKFYKHQSLFATGNKTKELSTILEVWGWLPLMHQTSVRKVNGR